MLSVQRVEGTQSVYSYGVWNLRTDWMVCNLFCNCNTFSLLDMIIWSRVILFETPCIILLHVSLPSCLFLMGFQPNFCTHFSYLPYELQAPHISSSLVKYADDISSKVQIMKSLIRQFSTATSWLQGPNFILGTPLPDAPVVCSSIDATHKQSSTCTK